MPKPQEPRATGPERLPTPAPTGFRVERTTPLGRHPLLRVFPGLGALATARRQASSAADRAKLYGTTEVELVDEDLWMYVAPRTKLKSIRRRRFDPVVSPQANCIVVGESHLRTSEELVLFMDIFHELCHIQQRERGEELFDRPESYVRRPTELEAYRFVVAEARRLRVDDAFLREYLRVEWITDEEFAELLGAMGVPPA